MSTATGTETPTLLDLARRAADRLGRAGGGFTRPDEARLAAFALGRPADAGPDRADLDRPATDAERRRLDDLVARAEAGEPAAYTLGSWPFFGREFEVTRDTLIPRRDTEELVRIVLDDVRARLLGDRPRVLELCAGGGCVAITLALELPGADVVGVELSAGALAVARRNVRRHGLDDRVTLVRGDLFAPLAGREDARPFDLVVSNPPYIPTAGIVSYGPAVAENEPRMALDGGADGLDFHRRILAESPEFLAPGARVFLEHEHDQGAAALAVGREHAGRFGDLRVIRDARGRDRALAARLLPG